MLPTTIFKIGAKNTTNKKKQINKNVGRPFIWLADFHYVHISFRGLEKVSFLNRTTKVLPIFLPTKFFDHFNFILTHVLNYC